MVDIFDREALEPARAFEMALFLEVFHPHTLLGTNNNVRVKILVDKGMNYFKVVLNNLYFQVCSFCSIRVPFLPLATAATINNDRNNTTSTLK